MSAPGYKPEVRVNFEATLRVKFTLPGVQHVSSGGWGNSTQFESHFEGHQITVSADNAAETARVFRQVAEEIERVAVAAGRKAP